MAFMHNLKICCDEKRRLFTNGNLFNVLQVDPPYVLLTEIKKCASYKCTVTIKNVYAFPKTIEFANNFPSEIRANYPPAVLLPHDGSFSVDIFFEPTCSKKCYEDNKRYSFIILTDHPKVGFEVPVIIKKSVGGISTPENILMSTTSPNIPVYFSFPIINFSMESVPFTIRVKKSVTNLRYMPIRCVIPGRNSYMIFLEVVSPNMCPVLEELFIHFSKNYKSTVKVECYMEPAVLHPSDRVIRFPLTQLGVKVDQCMLLCNETNEQIKYKWCRNETKGESQSCIFTETEGETPQHVKKFNEYFEVKPKSDVFTHVSSESALFSFTPPAEFDDDSTEPPFQFTSNAYLAFSTCAKRMKFTLIGLADGPRIETLTTEHDFDKIFVGEKKFCDVVFTNIGKMKGKMEFAGTDGRFGCVAKADPKSEEIEPLQSLKVTIEFFATRIGQFIEKLIFKVKYAKPLSFIIKGTAIPLGIQVNPSKLDFGDVPFGILQKQYLEITNTLKIPIVVSPKAENDGDEEPVILFIDEEKFEDEINNDNDDDDEKISISSDLFSETQSHTHYSFWTLTRSMPCRGDIQKVLEEPKDNPSTGCNCDMFEEEYEYEDEEQSNMSSDHLRQSIETSDSKVSLEFQEILDNTSLLALNLVTNAIENKIAEEPEAEDQIISTILDEMYTFEHVNKQVEKMHFTKRNWTKTSEYPREVLLEPKSLYIEPGQTIRTLICVIANRNGLSNKILTLRITPVSESFEEESKYICSRALSVTIPISFNCVLPVLHLNQTVNHVKTHIGVPQQFSLRVKNLSKIAGFVCFNIIPKNNVVELLIYPRKFLIKAEGWRKIHFKVTSFRPGETCLTGIIGILGNKRPMIYKIIVDVEPPAIAISPEKIHDFVKVITNNDYAVQITNTSPTEAHVYLSLEKSDYVRVMPKEAIIPPGQILDITLFTFFRDNTIYTNNLLIDVEHSGTSKVNIKFDVQGIPIIVQCNGQEIIDGLDFGTLFTYSHPYKALLTFTNNGELQYKLFITKLKKSKNVKEKAKAVTEGFRFDKYMHNLYPGETKNATVEIKGLSPEKFEEEFSFDVIRGKIKRKIHFYNFIFRAAFTKPDIKWSKERLCFNIINSELPDVQNKVIEKVMLENRSNIPTIAELKVEGSFKLFHAKGNCPKQLVIEIQPKASKMVEVIFTPQERVDKLSAIYDGRVLLKSGGKTQKPLELIATLVFPVVDINEEELDYFARQQEFYSIFKISNPGQLTSVYKWQLMEEIESPLNYINTTKMQEQKSVSQEILAKPSHGYLDFSINVEQEYLDTFTKLANLEEKDDDEAVEGSGNENKSKSNSFSTTVPSKTSKEDKKKKSKKNETVEDTKKGKIGKGKNKKKKDPSAAKEEPIPKPSFSLLDIKNIIDKVTPQISVDMREVAEEVDEFLYLNCAKDDSDDIMEHLEPEICAAEMKQLEKYVYLDHYKGCIDPDSARNITIFFAGHEREITHKAKFQLEVEAGNTAAIDITIFNVNAAVQISQTHFDFGYQPWYKVIQRKIALQNCNQMTMKINITENAYLENYHKLYMGFLTVTPNGVFYILNDMILELTVNIYMGFSAIFKEAFGVEVNNNIPTPVIFTGKAAIPMLSILNVERPFLGSVDRNMEYKTLNKIFLKEVDCIEVVEPEPCKTELYKLQQKLLSFPLNSVDEENLKSQSYAESDRSEKPPESNFDNSELHLEGEIKLNDLYIGNDGRILKFKNSKIEHRAVVISKLDKEVEDYHVLDYPEVYPPVLYIEKRIETSKFLESLKLNEEVRSAFKNLSDKYVLTSLKSKNKEQGRKKPTMQIRDVVVEPLPFNATSYYLPFEFIRLNEELVCTLELFWHGPGRLVLAARTTIAIPGLKAEFSEYNAEPSLSDRDSKSSLKKMIIFVYPTTPEITPNFKYINKTERYLNMHNEEEENTSSENCDKCKGSLLCRKHSYDLDSYMIHTRRIASDLKPVKEHYSNLLKKKKDPFVLCQLVQEDDTSVDEIVLGLTIKFHPTDEFYQEGMIFEDYLLIDVHLGPIIPILLRGPIKSNSYSPEDN